MCRGTVVGNHWDRQCNSSCPEKFHAILVRKNQTSTRREKISIEVTNSEETVKLLGVTLDCKLDFVPRISKILQKGCNTANVLQRLKSFIGSKEKKILVQSKRKIPNELKSAENLITFKRLMKNYNGPSCRCSACQCLPMQNALKIKTKCLFTFET